MSRAFRCRGRNFDSLAKPSHEKVFQANEPHPCQCQRYTLVGEIIAAIDVIRGELHSSTFLNLISVMASILSRYDRFSLPEHAPIDRIEFQ